MVTQNFYHPSTDYWLVFLAVFECSTSGLVYPSKLNIVALTPNIYDRSSGANTADIFRIIFALYIIYIYVMTVLELRVGKRNIKHAVSFQGLMDLLLVFMIIVSVIMATNINKNEEEIYLKQSYTDLYDIVQLYKQYQNINSTTLILVLIRIIVFMSVNKRIYTLTVMVQHASRNMISFLIILISVLSALALIAESIWGTYIYMYRTYTYSFLSLLLLYIGHGDYKVMFDGDLS